ncbi:hypothetical protein PG996_003781 [Apiospora saccharicola]|uniref:Uncharacterized protein n=1 Tax=Apiospora saccharicola TaxID=335842 RepID=A0ABR1W291_9PEZI
MRFFEPLTLAVGLVAAVSSGPQGASPKKARIPSPASLKYIMSMTEPALKRDVSGLASLPDDLASRVSSYDSPVGLDATKRQLSKQDFYECQSSVSWCLPTIVIVGSFLMLIHPPALQSPPPQPSDCNTVIDQVQTSNQDFILNEGTCLAFTFSTCTGYFCSLCGQLATHTDFIASQFESVQGLCVEAGQAGTIVGEDAPQYETGFLRAGSGVPTYDVC